MMKPYLRAEALTENELHDEIRFLEERGDKGELTATDAERLSRLKACLFKIRGARRVRW